ncbi:MAG: hypothetical protein GWO41_02490, partial [candidate division Zixibacteria bacterium]|nr:hypothetical protein [candidate division Zixibacteria bacterium]NIW42597.1 hypothetical protein [candidate division Zixibacteria bacterium]NIX58773.1 hypothetical protein [candidate division Zixibacteria bacterium]
GGVYYLHGQVDPHFEITLVINSEKVKTILPNLKRRRLFIKEVDAAVIQSGSNQLKVVYQKRSGRWAKPIGPSFRVKLKYQSDPMDKDSAKVLAQIRGPGQPFTKLPKSGELSEIFQAP